MLSKPIDSIGFVSSFDPELAAMMDREFTRQKDGLELIASENFASPAVKQSSLGLLFLFHFLREGHKNAE